MDLIFLGTLLFVMYLILVTVVTSRKSKAKTNNEVNRYTQVFDELDKCKIEIDNEKNKNTGMGTERTSI